MVGWRVVWWWLVGGRARVRVSHIKKEKETLVLKDRTPQLYMAYMVAYGALFRSLCDRCSYIFHTCPDPRK